MSDITHTGKIKKILNKNAEIELLDNPECSSCSIKGHCNVSKSGDKIINIQINEDGFTLYDTVEVVMSTKTAFKALFWSYLFPIVILVLSVVILSNFINEGVAGLISILILLLYYLVIYLNKDYFKSIFNLSIKHL